MAAITFPYLGKPGIMYRLPAPTGPLEAPPSRFDVEHVLAGGGTTVRKLLDAKRRWTLPYDLNDEAGASTIDGFYRGVYGLGPYRFVDPTIRNVLALDPSATGARTNAAVGWGVSATTAGTLAPDIATAPPPLLFGASVLTWTSPTASAWIHPSVPTLPGTNLTTAGKAIAPVVLSQEAVTVSLYVKAASSVAMTLYAQGYNDLGQQIAQTSTAFTATTSWQRITALSGAGFLTASGCNYVLPRLAVGATAPTSVSISAAQVEYGTTATAWQPGHGSPTVVILGTPGRTTQVIGAIDQTLTLAEV